MWRRIADSSPLPAKILLRNMFPYLLNVCPVFVFHARNMRLGWRCLQGPDVASVIEECWSVLFVVLSMDRRLIPANGEWRNQ